ncbi:MAG: membrane dipeptidase, partial [Alloprevotella sp.]
MNTEKDTSARQTLSRRPVIGITANFEDGQFKLQPGYVASVEAVGGQPLLLSPRRPEPGEAFDVLDHIDGLILSGGADLNPLLVGEDPVPALGNINSVRDEFELELIRQAYVRGIPMLGICRGIQMLAAALGGKIEQDIATAHPGTSLVKHSQQAPKGTATHFVSTEPGLIRDLFGERFAVNSFHHQAVGDPGCLFRVTARSSDGVIEAMESRDSQFVVGVQWHPECFLPEGDASMLPLFRRLTEAASGFERAKAFHRRCVTLDSHCDTPMVFPALDHPSLNVRSDVALVDFVKMREGGLHATIMVAYLKQGKEFDEAAYAAVDEKTRRILAQIETWVKNAAPAVSLAATPAEVRDNFVRGVTSVMRGIENGYAIGEDLAKLEEYRKMGLVYVTLCHNNDNQICESARHDKDYEILHKGLSDFGKKVVKEMNRVGLLVDLSHASEQTFFDVLARSEVPVVCSHSNCRALCDHPRNLTDEQLKALAEKGGVVQINFYHGFLRKEGEASVEDVVRHILHAMEVAGEDHVGIGSDFDGDGGVRGLASASAMINLTRLLLQAGITEAQLEKLWGGNFLRVMQEVQEFAKTR